MAENLEPNLEKSSLNEGIFKLKLSGRSFNRGLTINSVEGFIKNRIRTIYSIDIDLDVNPEFIYCDFKDNIELYMKGNGKRDNEEIIFRGVIERSFVKGKILTLIAQDFSLRLNYIVRIEASKFLGLNDLLSLLLIPVEEEIRLGATPDIPDISNRDFIIIVPIKNLILNKDFSIGGVAFYRNFDTLDDKFIGQTNSGKEVTDWSTYPTRARVIKNASEFRSALIEGYNEISTAIDLIAFRNDLSFPKLEIGDGINEFQLFNYHELVSQVTISTWAYCREDETDLYALLNLNFLNDNVFKIDSDHSYLHVVDQLFSKLLLKNNKTQDEKRLIMSLHWLRRSIQTGDNKDKLLDLWTAMEFLIGGTKVDALFSVKKIESIKELLGSNQESLELTVMQLDALFKKIDMLNDAPLMVRIDALKNKLKIYLTEEEKELIKTARSKRNKINHGEDVEVFNKELSKLRSIIERLLIGKISLSNTI